MQCVYNICGVHVMLCTSCDCRQDHGDAYSDASKGFWLDMMKACSMRGDAGQPALQMAAERLISVHLLYAEELMATSRREHARAEAEALEAQKVRALTTISSLHTLFVSTVEDCTMCLLAPTPPLRRHHTLLYIAVSSSKVLAAAWSQSIPYSPGWQSSTALHACAANRLHPSCCAGYCLTQSRSCMFL